MSQFDPVAPNNGYPCFNPLLGDGEKRYGAQTGNTTASAVAALNTVISASTAYNVINQNCRGAIIYFRPTVFPGSASTTVALKVRLQTDPIAGGGTQQVIASFQAVSGSAGIAYMVYPNLSPPATPGGVTGFSASANYVNMVLPRNYQIFLSLSTGATSKEVTFSLSVMHIL